MSKETGDVKFRRLLVRFVAHEGGATAIEYALVASIMAVTAVTFSGIFDALRDNFMAPTESALGGV